MYRFDDPRSRLILVRVNALQLSVVGGQQGGHVLDLAV